VIITTDTGKARWKQLRYIILSGWTDATRTTKQTYPNGGNPAVPQIVVSRFVYSPLNHPRLTPITNAVILQIDATHNPTLLGFDDLVYQFDPPVVLPYYSEVKFQITSNVAMYMDVYIGIEVI
jgi:hypothetical protein